MTIHLYIMILSACKLQFANHIRKYIILESLEQNECSRFNNETGFCGNQSNGFEFLTIKHRVTHFTTIAHKPPLAHWDNTGAKAETLPKHCISTRLLDVSKFNDKCTYNRISETNDILQI